MIEKMRATRESDKLERRGEILDAAERLFVSRPTGLASMDELAEASGVAKGTLYLYFPSKEEVLVALHERHAERFFALLSRRVADTPRFTLDDLFHLVRRHIIESPTFLPVSTLVVAYMERSVPLESVIRLRASMGEKVMEAGTQIERALNLAAGEGARLIQFSFALIVGLWQITSCGRISGANCPAPMAGFVNDFPAEVRRGFDALWRGATHLPAPTRERTSHDGKRKAVGRDSKAAPRRTSKPRSNRK